MEIYTKSSLHYFHWVHKTSCNKKNIQHEAKQGFHDLLGQQAVDN